MELDLTSADLEYLRYEWAGDNDAHDDNPRGRAEFGRYRSHDRVINWREIYNDASP